jgi:hypothetical protein
MVEHDHEKPSGRSIASLGLCVSTETCRALGHRLVRTTLPRSEVDPTVVDEICIDCTEIAGRFEGLRLWQSVCPCCFSSAFPSGLPSAESLHGRASGAPTPATPRVAPASGGG